MFRTNEKPVSDLHARSAIRNWKALVAKGQHLQRYEARLLATQFQPETRHPERIGMDELTDEYTPEELIALCAKTVPTMVDWDTLEANRNR